MVGLGVLECARALSRSAGRKRPRSAPPRLETTALPMTSGHQPHGTFPPPMPASRHSQLDLCPQKSRAVILPSIRPGMAFLRDRRCSNGSILALHFHCDTASKGRKGHWGCWHAGCIPCGVCASAQASAGLGTVQRVNVGNHFSRCTRAREKAGRQTVT